MIYLAAFALVFIGFVLGFFTAAICAAAGRAEREDEILEQELRDKTHSEKGRPSK
jgi:hypothetical protein